MTNGLVSGFVSVYGNGIKIASNRSNSTTNKAFEMFSVCTHKGGTF